MTQGGFGFRTKFSIEVRRDGKFIADRMASISSCTEAALFAEILAGRVANDGSMPSFIATPIWTGPSPEPPEAEPNPPAVEALELRCNDGPVHRYDRAVFAAQAGAFISDLVASKQLEAGDPVVWSVTACEDESPAARFSARVTRDPLPLADAHLPDLSPGEVAAQLDASLLELLSQGFRESGPIERAWLLVGSVEHDSKQGAALIHGVTAVAVAQGRGGASQTHFAFEPGPFVEARERAYREFDGLVPIGWAHTHPPCEACPQNPACPSDTRFFSAADVEVHTSAFPSAFMVALVVGKVGAAPATEPGFRLYGWRDAQMTEITYRVPDSASAWR
jgi:hypothetical protein